MNRDVDDIHKREQHFVESMANHSNPRTNSGSIPVGRTNCARRLACSKQQLVASTILDGYRSCEELRQGRSKGPAMAIFDPNNRLHICNPEASKPCEMEPKSNHPASDANNLRSKESLSMTETSFQECKNNQNLETDY